MANIWDYVPLVSLIRQAGRKAEESDIELQKKKAEITPITESLVTPQVKTAIAEAEAEPIPLSDIMGGELTQRRAGLEKAKQIALEGQEKYGTMTPTEFKKIAPSSGAGAGYAPKSFQSYLVNQVNQGTMTLEEAENKFNTLFPSIRVHPITGELFDVKRGVSVAGGVDRTKKNRTYEELTPKERNIVDTEIEKFESNKVIQAINERVAKADESFELLKRNPANAYGILAGALTRFAGEVGRLTDYDIDRNIKPKDLAGRVKQALLLWKEGRFPQERVEEIGIILKIAQEAAKKTHDRLLQNFVNTTSLRIPNVDKENLTQLIGGRSLFTHKQPRATEAQVQITPSLAPQKQSPQQIITPQNTENDPLGLGEF